MLVYSYDKAISNCGHEFPDNSFCKLICWTYRMCVVNLLIMAINFRVLLSIELFITLLGIKFVTFLLTTTISVFQWNMRSFHSQRLHFQKAVDDLYPDVLFLQETNIFPHSQCYPSSYRPLVRHDHPMQRRSGAAILMQ